MDALQKVRVVLPHWIEHNQGHMDESRKWVQALRDEGKDDVAALIDEAIASMDQAGQLLAQAFEKAGGAMDQGGDHHHHHHHHHHD
ncbi:MAG: hypothetical protein H8E79_07080 [Desulfobulbaceae bacterium]|uniref:DUF8180 domain-containing protein n=1 Tax=Candidatus Desulfatifera sulfidica TaxID=2841691 RepID=A0A8J6TDY5_9BACT|nr:hypothetical protein [Candidatus Desulfatifera sulfidica]